MKLTSSLLLGPTQRERQDGVLTESAQLPRLKMVLDLMMRKSHRWHKILRTLISRPHSLNICPSDEATTGLPSLAAQEQLKGVQVSV